jgi:hypothetical protein
MLASERYCCDGEIEATLSVPGEHVCNGVRVGDASPGTPRWAPEQACAYICVRVKDCGSKRRTLMQAWAWCIYPQNDTERVPPRRCIPGQV